MLNRIKSAVIVGLLALTGIGVSAAPAHADQNAGYEYFDPHDQGLGDWGHEGGFALTASIPCPANVVCTYSEANYGGDMYYYSALGSCTEIGPLWSGRISSIINNKTLPIRAHYNAGCSTHIWNVTIGNVPPNNKASFNFGPPNDHVKSLSYA